MNEKLLQQLLLAVVSKEEAQRRFRMAVLLKLGKIETIMRGHQLQEHHKSFSIDQTMAFL